MYTVFRIYDDCTTHTEYVDDISSALSAAAIYLEDESCIIVKIVKTSSKKLFLNYYREQGNALFFYLCNVKIM